MIKIQGQVNTAQKLILIKLGNTLFLNMVHQNEDYLENKEKHHIGHLVQYEHQVQALILCFLILDTLNIKISK